MNVMAELHNARDELIALCPVCFIHCPVFCAVLLRPVARERALAPPTT